MAAATATRARAGAGGARARRGGERAEATRRTKAGRARATRSDAEDGEDETRVVVYATRTGTARRYAATIRRRLNDEDAAATGGKRGYALLDAASLVDPEKVLAGGKRVVAIFVVSTHDGGEAPESSAWFARWAREAAYDERTGWMYLKNVRYAVFGCGNREYGDNFNRAGRELDAQLARMGGERLARRCDGDEASGRMEKQFEEWGEKVIRRLSNSTASSGDDAAHSRVGVAEERDQSEYASEGEDDEEGGERGRERGWSRYGGHRRR